MESFDSFTSHDDNQYGEAAKKNQGNDAVIILSVRLFSAYANSDRQCDDNMS